MRFIVDMVTERLWLMCLQEVEEDKKAFESTVHQRPVSPSPAAETQRQPHANVMDPLSLG